MRVLLLAENWPPRRGGIENYLANVASHLLEGEVEVRVVAPRGRGRLDSTRSESSAGSPVVEHQRFFWPLIRPRWLPLFIRLWREAKRTPWDVTLCGKALFEGLLGYYLKKHLGIPYVVFTYAMEIDVWSEGERQKRKLTRVLKDADRVVYINDEMGKKLRELGVSEKQLVKIWPGVGDQFFGASPAGPAARLHPASAQDLARSQGPHLASPAFPEQINNPYILCVARLVGRKGVDLLIEAFGKLDQVKFGNIELVIVGDGPEREKLEELAKHEWVNKSVRFLGAVQDEELPQLYTKALIFALTPRAAEGFGIVYIEAAAAGVSSVATLVGGAKEAVVHKETGIVVQPRVEAIREALEYLLGDEVERKRMGDNAKRRADDQFRWRKRILLVKGMLDAVMAEQSKKNSRH